MPNDPSDTDNLVSQAQMQLDEHRAWLEAEIRKVDPGVFLGSGAPAATTVLAAQAREIKLRVVKTSGRTVSVVWDYPDELYAYLRSELAPKHLRDTLADGHVVDPNQPASSWRRATPADEE